MTSGHSGIYYIEDSFPFQTQIIVTRELDQKTHTWLRVLSGKLDKEDIQDLLDKMSLITGKNDREVAAPVLEVGIEANRYIIEESYRR